MKQCLPFLFLVLSLFLLGSCAGLQQAQTKTSAPNTSPRFINNVAISTNQEAITTIHPGKNSKKKTKINFSRHFPKTIGLLIRDSLFTHDTLLARFIKNWLGTPYRFGGTTKKGIDCSAFSKKLYKKVYHLPLLRTAHAQFRSCVPIFNMKNLEEGDLVFFKIHSSRISHVGVYLSNGYFVNASNHGVRICNLNNTYWKRYFYAGGEMPSVSSL